MWISFRRDIITERWADDLASRLFAESRNGTIMTVMTKAKPPADGMEYQDPKPMSRDVAERELSAKESIRVCDALVSLAFHEPDWRWVQSKCIELVSHHTSEVRGLAVTCFGHLARIHGRLDLDLVTPILDRLKGDAEIGGRVQDALDDIELYIDERRIRLKALLNGVGGPLTTQEREKVAEFIEVNEFGLALETLVGYLVEGRHHVPRRMAEEALKLADRMELSSNFLRGLRVDEATSPNDASST